MKRPNFNEKTEVKVISKELIRYGQRGTVVSLRVDIDGKSINPLVDKEFLKQAYADGLESKMTWYACVRFADEEYCWFKANELEAVQHKFIDIDYIREEDLDLGTVKPDGTKAIRPRNTGAFEPGDTIQISTKIDGANASIAWDETTGKLEIFSRTNLLDSPGALRGFYDYIKTEVEPKIPWAELALAKDIVIFGEWCVGHSIKTYNKDWYNKWRIYDIWDKRQNEYWAQDMVKSFCEKFGLEYVEELYYGPFISWDHCRSFLHASKAYGPDQEGIVIKNQTKLGSLDNKSPVYIKIVNEKFVEHMHSKKEKKPIDPAIAAEKQKAEELIASVVTEARVKKLILKLVDEGILPTELSPRDMSTCMKHLPKRLFEDLLKEEPEAVAAASTYAGKATAALASKFAKEIIIGK